MKAAVKSGLQFFMKTKILLIISILFSGAAFSQDINIGVRAGINSTGIRGDASESLNQLIDKTGGILMTSDRTGFFAGLDATVPITENFEIGSGLYYSQKGYDIKGGFNVKGLEFLGASAKAGLKTQYIDLPVLLTANLNGLKIFAGPQVSYLTGADLKTTAGVLGINLLNKTIDVTDQFNRWDVGLTGGIGYQFSNGVSLMASYDYGLLKVDAAESVSAFNRGIKLGIGIHF